MPSASTYQPIRRPDKTPLPGPQGEVKHRTVNLHQQIAEPTTAKESHDTLDATFHPSDRRSLEDPACPKDL